MFKRKVKIFGRSVPLAAAVLAITAVVALAAWLVIVATLSVDVTTASFSGTDIYVASYSKGAGASACNVNLSTGSVTWPGAMIGESCEVIAEVHNDGSIPAVLNLDLSLADPGVIVDDTGHAGTVLAASGIYNYRWVVSLDALLSDPGTAYNFTFDLTALPQ